MPDTPVANFRLHAFAQMAAGLLDAADIPYRIQSMEGAMYGPIGPGATIYVPERLADQAKQILADANLDRGFEGGEPVEADDDS